MCHTFINEEMSNTVRHRHEQITRNRQRIFLTFFFAFQPRGGRFLLSHCIHPPSVEVGSFV